MLGFGRGGGMMDFGGVKVGRKLCFDALNTNLHAERGAIR
jgi:hypothetical protein